MEKKGNGVIVVLLVVLILVVAIVGIILVMNSKSSVTGNVVSEAQQPAKNNQQTQSVPQPTQSTPTTTQISPPQTTAIASQIPSAIVVCNTPYIQVGGSCCLDRNGNKICDNDETPVSAPVTPYSPGKYISKMCVINNPLSCDESSIAAGAITLNIRNGGGEDYSISNIAITGCIDYTNTKSIANGGTSGAIAITCSGLASGDEVNKDITITYKKTGGTIDQVVTGSISGQVE